MTDGKDIRRNLCYVLVSIIPGEGLPELLETLVDIHEFYSAQTELEKTLPQFKEVKARHGETTVRPDFSVNYDEE